MIARLLLVFYPVYGGDNPTVLVVISTRSTLFWAPLLGPLLLVNIATMIP